jgi:putative protein kinase ArgK-like GTPase of G3E family
VEYESQNKIQVNFSLFSRSFVKGRVQWLWRRTTTTITTTTTTIQQQQYNKSIVDVWRDDVISQSFRIGFSGAPGVGKSTLIDTLGLHILQHTQHKIAVLVHISQNTLTHTHRPVHPKWWSIQ